MTSTPNFRSRTLGKSKPDKQTGLKANPHGVTGPQAAAAEAEAQIVDPADSLVAADTAAADTATADTAAADTAAANTAAADAALADAAKMMMERVAGT